VDDRAIDHRTGVLPIVFNAMVPAIARPPEPLLPKAALTVAAIISALTLEPSTAESDNDPGAVTLALRSPPQRCC